MRRSALRHLHILSAASAAAPTPDTDGLVANTTQYPWNSIGLIQHLNTEGHVVSSCTGALIANNIVLTAASCMISPVSGNRASISTFTPGYNPNVTPSEPFGTVGVLQWEVSLAYSRCISDHPGEHTTDCHQAVDFAVLLVDADYTAWTPLGYDSSDTFNEIINTAGYPGI